MVGERLPDSIGRATFKLGGRPEQTPLQTGVPSRQTIMTPTLIRPAVMRKPPPVRQLYSTPRGYQDFPFIWAFDGTTLIKAGVVAGFDSLNNSIYILGGWGDFIMRRCVGLSTVLNSGIGSFLIRDSQKRPLASDPTITPPILDDDFMFPNELFYPETSIIGFDLFNCNIFSTGISPEPPEEIFTSQIVFQGVRRLPYAGPVRDDSCDWDERSFCYVLKGTITALGPISFSPPNPPTPLPGNPDLILTQQINDYDFDLYQVIITYQGTAASIVTAVNIYDANKNRISNIPILDVYYNGRESSSYKNGAMVPPLRYRRNTQFRMDLFSLSAVEPVTVTVHLIGKQRYPRGYK
jgi:hypothetical protein